MPVIKTYSALVTELNNRVSIAVENACNRLLGTLQEMIDSEFYDQFTPEYYQRTYQFWRSATTRMLNSTCGEILMDENLMHYTDGWTGEKQIRAAAEGYHGKWDRTEGRFWESFVDYCEANAREILKEELGKQGINVK